MTAWYMASLFYLPFYSSNGLPGSFLSPNLVKFLLLTGAYAPMNVIIQVSAQKHFGILISRCKKPTKHHAPSRFPHELVGHMPCTSTIPPVISVKTHHKTAIENSNSFPYLHLGQMVGIPKIVRGTKTNSNTSDQVTNDTTSETAGDGGDGRCCVSHSFGVCVWECKCKCKCKKRLEWGMR